MTSLGPFAGHTTTFSFALVNFDWIAWHTYEHDNWRLVDALFSSLITVNNILGVWDHDIAVSVGDRYVDRELGSLWEAQVAHTTASSGTFADDRAANPTFWEEISPIRPVFRGAWANDVIYNENDFVVDGHRYAVANTAHASSSAPNTFDDDIANWEVLADLTTSVDGAAASAAAAATSETNAATSEANAATSETNAAASEAAASASEIAAAASEASAATSETNAATSETNAANSAAAALTSENNAATSETNAATSETNAATSETNAAASEAKAELWAEEDEDVEVEPGLFSAKHWAAKAEESAQSVTSVNGETGVVVLDNVDVGAQPLGQITGINTQAGTTYTAIAGDRGKLILCTNASGCTITFDDDVHSAGDVIHAMGTQGQVTLSAGSGVTGTSPATFADKTLEAAAIGTVLFTAVDQFYRTGALEPA